MHQAIYEYLKAKARQEKLATYGEIAPLANLDMANQADRNRIGEILGEISTFEHQHKRPLLSVIVIHKNGTEPGPGFFNLAKALGIQNQQDNDSFFIAELNRVYHYWKNQP